MLDTNRKPDIHYPCRWEYTIIGSDVDHIRAAVDEVMGRENYSLDFSHRSASGKYFSMSMDIVVPSEKYRLELYDKLAAHPHVRIVL